MKCINSISVEDFLEEIHALKMKDHLEYWYIAMNRVCPKLGIVDGDFGFPIAIISYSQAGLEHLKQKGYLTTIWVEFQKVKKERNEVHR